ncbi:PaaX family transcriptional regulator C-terminal domain-containing protein [Gordonia rubripertincta]|uniref:PaaX domain-containing protein, C- domain protein n=1 Tax=Gordonia rubripertincta TaxID=36822 RepID=A0ABT4MYQ5_GORRU|nr:PaaX family transcriptional regulator C-terminal domain-containing protein [Gordonia rubripertincta]MCZ4552137.1 PaaX domain-containing protein, C- domain protein [Gordonia rubripertincta]
MTTGASGVRKLTARSVILSTLLGFHSAQAQVRGVLSLATELGLQESAVRVALTRMVAAGDLERHDGMYRLSARLIERQRRQDEALHPVAGPWDGRWCMAVVTTGATGSSDRAAVRDSLRAARCGELREGVWARPANIEVVVTAEVRARLTLFSAVPEGSQTALVARLFALDLWAYKAEGLLAAMDNATAMSERFEVAAAMVRHTLDDPLLPAELLPDNWPGERLREGYENFRKELTALAERLFAAG